MTNLSSITGFAQTKSSWARVIESIEDLPPLYAVPVRNLPESQEGQHGYLVFIPSYLGFFQKAEDKLIAAFDQRMYLLERKGQRIHSVCFPYPEVKHVEAGSVLLKSWITITGLTDHGELATATIVYNAVRDSLFNPILQRVRPNPPTLEENDISKERVKFEPLLGENYKLANLARLSLRKGERAEGIALQAELRTTIISFFGFHLTRTIFPAHISYLTNSEFVILQDDPRPGHGKYGSLWRYLRQDAILGVGFSRREDDLYQLSLQLANHGDFYLLFSAERHAELTALQNRLKPDLFAASR